MGFPWWECNGPTLSFAVYGNLPSQGLMEGANAAKRSTHNQHATENTSPVPWGAILIRFPVRMTYFVALGRKNEASPVTSTE